MKIRVMLFCLMVLPGLVVADADGPDYWEVRDVAEGDVLNIRTAADWRSPKIGEIPHDGRCVRNHGCVGGLTFEEFSTLSTAEQQRILKKRPRWCEIDYQGVRGWVAGRYLREGQDTCD
ncbi:MAG: SH3 domain-containing protein [Candidatus Competibacteraceae bacterium]